MPELISTIPQNTTLVPTVVAGFGDYDLPEGKTFAQMQTAAKSQRIFFAIMMGILAIAAVSLINVSVPFSVVSSSACTFVMVKMILDAFGVGNRAPPMNYLFPAEKLALMPGLTELTEIPCSGFPTINGPDSQSWKEELIKAARKSIVMSGCYCGGRTFDTTLDLMAERMALLPELKIEIIASSQMITSENLARIARIGERFPNQFNCLITDEVFPYVSPTTNTLTLSTNHTKAMVIDYGTYFMLGGSGIVSSWAEQDGTTLPTNVEIKPGCMNKLFDAVFKMRAYRDMDFVFRSEINGAGTRLHVEMTKLIERMRYRDTSEVRIPDSDWALEAPAPCERFDLMAPAQDLKVACYATGPEQADNSFLEEMITQIDGAQDTIVINNLYFHPNQRLLDSLINASNRGVHITILTNTNGARSPGLHGLYTSRSRKHVSLLFQGIPKPNIELYEYEVDHSTLHKKVMIIDRKTTMLGSTNIGKKCLESHDYEINIKVESEEFAEQVSVSMEADKAICTRVPTEEACKVSCMTAFASKAQSALGCFL